MISQRIAKTLQIALKGRTKTSSTEPPAAVIKAGIVAIVRPSSGDPPTSPIFTVAKRIFFR